MTRHRSGTRAPHRGASGFTLLELVIVLLVLAILAGLALPSYRSHALRAQRAEAIRVLLGIAACQERLRAAGGWYRPSRCLDGVVMVAYRFRIEPAAAGTALEFVALAEPAGAQAADRCGTLGLDQAGHRTASGEGASDLDCWSGR